MKKTLLIMASITLLAFTTADIRSMYKVPREAASVCAADIDMDGDIDIVVGHYYSFQTKWSGVSILKNSGEGNFILSDTIFVFGGGGRIYVTEIDTDSILDIVGLHSDNGTIFASILYNNNGTYLKKYFQLGLKISDIYVADINDDAAADIIFISNNNKYWGILYNDGFGNFSSPEYHNLNYYPQNIVAGNLNNDGTDDIVISGSTEIYFSKNGGFQNQQLGGYTSRVHIADMDNDGDNDIVGLYDLFGLETDITIFENKGEETFEKHNNTHILFGSPFSVIADFNNDTLPDLMILPASNDGVYIFFNKGGFDFKEPVFVEIPNDGEAYRRATVADLDGNGYNDIIIVRRTGPHAATYNNVIILFNDGNGHFVNHPLDVVENQTGNEVIRFINYPNPFTTETTFQFTIKETSLVELSVYNLQGKLIKSLIQKTLKGGMHKIKWDGLDNVSQTCKSGPYIAYLKVNGSFIQSVKLIKY